MNIQEVLSEIVKRQHSIAVYSDVIDYLEEYLPSDTEPVPEETLTVEGSCFEPKVTQEAIEAVIETLSGILSEEQKELDKLNSMEIKPNEKPRKQPAKRSATKPKRKQGK
tara:strand:+ start:45385 stop:45714 length:330 start_codon:yes stop_codon:yes gene_type:complete